MSLLKASSNLYSLDPVQIYTIDLSSTHITSQLKSIVLNHNQLVESLFRFILLILSSYFILLRQDISVTHKLSWSFYRGFNLSKAVKCIIVVCSLFLGALFTVVSSYGEFLCTLTLSCFVDTVAVTVCQTVVRTNRIALVYL